MLEQDAGDTGFDLGASMDAIASDIMGKGDDKGSEPDYSDVDPGDTHGDTELASPAPQGDPKAQAGNAPSTPQVRTAPKAWAKEQHEHWGKLDPKVQDYIELREKQMLDGLDQYKTDAQYAKQLRNVINPYGEFLKSQGVSEPEAIQYLLNAHYALTTGSPEQRAQLFEQLGRDLGITQSGNGQNGQNDPVMDLRKKVDTLLSDREAQQRASVQEKRQKADLETSTFAADPTNVHFNEVAQDMVPLVKAGYSLKDAYETAVYRNPVTRQKELDRLSTEAKAKAAEKAKAEADAAKRAAGTNIRAAHTQTAPTEPKGSMEDTMHETLKKIRARSS